MRHVIVSATALIALAACGETPAAGTQTADAAPIVERIQLVSPPLGADGLPRLRPGLWLVTRTDDGETKTSRQCMGAEADAEIRAFLTRETPDCVVRRSSGAGGLKLSAECEQAGGVKTRTEFAMTGSNTAYDMRLGLYVVTSDGRSEGSETVAKARWTSACPADMKPGDEVEG